MLWNYNEWRCFITVIISLSPLALGSWATSDQIPSGKQLISQRRDFLEGYWAVTELPGRQENCTRKPCPRQWGPQDTAKPSCVSAHLCTAPECCSPFRCSCLREWPWLLWAPSAWILHYLSILRGLLQIHHPIGASGEARCPLFPDPKQLEGSSSGF